MIQFCEIINFGNAIRIVTKQAGSDIFDEPIEFEITDEIVSFEDLINVIKSYLDK
jgi:hypothetical protein